MPGTRLDSAHEHFWRARLLVEEAGDGLDAASPAEASLVGRAYAEIWRGLLLLAAGGPPETLSHGEYQDVRTKVAVVTAEPGPVDVLIGAKSRHWMDDPFAIGELG